MIERVQSLACVRVRLDDGKAFSGCGYGWTAIEVAKPVCPRCGKAAKITGAYSVVPLR